jgi:pimeloyl-ACP methyl ester carboxylesterase
MAPLARALAPDHLTLAMTLPGDPESPAAGPDPRRAGFDEIVAAMERLLLDSGLERAVICGTSFGGMAAIRFALDRPERTLALVLHATTARPALPLRRYRRLLAWPLLSILLLDLRLMSEFRAECRASFPAGRDRRRFYRESVRLRFSTRWSVRAMGARLQAIHDLDFTARLGEIRAPTLVLSGEPRLDRIMPPDEGRWLADHIPDAEHRVVAGTGHLGTLARPDLVAAEIERFLAARLRPPG